MKNLTFVISLERSAMQMLTRFKIDACDLGSTTVLIQKLHQEIRKAVRDHVFTWQPVAMLRNPSKLLRVPQLKI